MQPRQISVQPAARLLAIGLLVATSAAAQPEPDEPPTTLTETAVDSMLSIRDDLSHQIMETADRIDTFFGDPRMASDRNGSYVQVDARARAQEHEKPLYDTVLRAKLDLPRTEDRLKLVIEGDDPDSASGSGEPGADDPVDAIESESYFLALRYLLRETLRTRLETDAGVRLGSSSRLFVRSRLRLAEDFGDWATRFTETITWRTDDGWESSTRLDFDHPLTPALFFRSSTTADWTEVSEVFDLAQNFVVFHTPGDKARSLAYRFGIIGESDPVRSTDYVLDLRYRKRIYQTWLYYEIHPALNYPRERDYNVTPSILFTLSVIFGAS